MSWAELYALGARSGHEAGVLFFTAPDDVGADLGAEIHARAPRMAAPAKLAVPRSGCCDACGEPLPSYQGGWCPLCAAARAVALRGSAR